MLTLESCLHYMYRDVLLREIDCSPAYLLIFYTQELKHLGLEGLEVRQVEIYPLHHCCQTLPLCEQRQ